VIVLATLGAQQRRFMRRGKPVSVSDASAPAAVPVARATLIHAEALESAEAGTRWLDGLRRDPAALDAEVADAERELNAVLRAHRAAAADPYVREVSRTMANVVRVGFGSGDQVADGHFAEAYELPPESTSARAGRAAESMAPLERLAAVLSGTEDVGPSEELVLRARLDLDAGRMREAALQARIALEALLAECAGSAEDVDALSAHRRAVGDAANAALGGDVDPSLAAGVQHAVTEMRRVLRRVSGRF
jgi:hypothetical protein